MRAAIPDAQKGRYGPSGDSLWSVKLGSRVLHRRFERRPPVPPFPHTWVDPQFDLSLHRKRDTPHADPRGV